jgi:hypothetical protein
MRGSREEQEEIIGQLSFDSYQLSVVGYRLSVIGCRLSVVGCRLSVVSSQCAASGATALLAKVA